MTSQQSWRHLMGCLSLYSPSWKNIWDSSSSTALIFRSGGMGAGCSLWISPNPCWPDKAKPKFFDLFGKSFLFIHEFYCGQDMGKILALHVCTEKCFSFCSFKWREGFCSPPCTASLRGNCLYLPLLFPHCHGNRFEVLHPLSHLTEKWHSLPLQTAFLPLLCVCRPVATWFFCHLGPRRNSAAVMALGFHGLGWDK